MRAAHCRHALLGWWKRSDSNRECASATGLRPAVHSYRTSLPYWCGRRDLNAHDIAIVRFSGGRRSDSNREPFRLERNASTICATKASYRESDLNRHWTRSERVSSAVGIPRRIDTGRATRTRTGSPFKGDASALGYAGELAAAAGIEPASNSVTGRCMTVMLHGTTSGDEERRTLLKLLARQTHGRSATSPCGAPEAHFACSVSRAPQRQRDSSQLAGDEALESSSRWLQHRATNRLS
jgi:hypothetical protein